MPPLVSGPEEVKVLFRIFRPGCGEHPEYGVIGRFDSGFGDAGCPSHKSKRHAVCSLVEGPLVLCKVHLCLDLPFFLLPGAIAYGRFIQSEQNTRWIWSHGRCRCLFQLHTSLARHLPSPWLKGTPFELRIGPVSSSRWIGYRSRHGTRQGGNARNSALLATSFARGLGESDGTLSWTPRKNIPT